MARNSASSFLQAMYASLQTPRVSRMRARPGGFPIAPWTPSDPISVEAFASLESENSFFRVYKFMIKTRPQKKCFLLLLRPGLVVGCCFFCAGCYCLPRMLHPAASIPASGGIPAAFRESARGAFLRKAASRTPALCFLAAMLYNRKSCGRGWYHDQLDRAAAGGH